MKRGFGIGLIAIVLFVSGIGFLSQLFTKPFDIGFTVLFMLALLVLYALLKDVKLK